MFSGYIPKPFRNHSKTFPESFRDVSAKTFASKRICGAPRRRPHAFLSCGGVRHEMMNVMMNIIKNLMLNVVTESHLYVYIYDIIYIYSIYIDRYYIPLYIYIVSFIIYLFLHLLIMYYDVTTLSPIPG